jgi:hypothetical protein
VGLFLPLVKADQVNHLVYARAAAEELDKSREIMDYASAVPAFQTWSKGFSDVTMGKSLGNVRAMHNPKHLAGVVKTLNFDDTAKGVDVCIKVLDPVDWDKIEHGGYTGISIGGGYAKKWPDPLDKSVTRYTPRLQEISFVDSPCIPSARIMEMQKQDGTVEEVLLKGVPRTFADLQAPRTFAQMEKGLIGAGVGGILGHYIGKEIGRRMAGGAAHQLGMAAARNGSRITVGEHLANVGAAEAMGRKVGAGVGTVAGLATGVSLTRRRKKGADALKQEILDNLGKAGFGSFAGAALRGAGGLARKAVERIRTSAAGVAQRSAQHATERGYRVKMNAAAFNKALGRAAPIVPPPVARKAVKQGSRTALATGSALAGAGATTYLSRRRSDPDTDALKQEILDNLEKANVAGAITYLSRGKLFSSAPIEHGAAFVGRHSKKVVTPAIKDPVSYTSRGKTFTHQGGETVRFTKQEILDNLDKASAEEKAKIETTMHEFKHGKLRSYRGVDAKGKPRKGPRVMDRKQAIAIALSQARRMGKMDDSVLVAALTDRLMKQAA